MIAKGPDVMLNSRAAQTFALLLHELATNATKYGALSLPDKGKFIFTGRSTGKLGKPKFKFQWQERDGPPVVVPTRTGFGSLLLERLASQDFGAQPKITFAPGGLSYSIDASPCQSSTTGEYEKQTSCVRVITHDPEGEELPPFRNT